MISYKRDVLERQSLSEVKIGKGFPICERVRKNIVEYFTNNVPRCQIAKALQMYFTVPELYNNNSGLHVILPELGHNEVSKKPVRLLPTIWTSLHVKSERMML